MEKIGFFVYMAWIVYFQSYCAQLIKLEPLNLYNGYMSFWVFFNLILLLWFGLFLLNIDVCLLNIKYLKLGINIFQNIPMWLYSSIKIAFFICETFFAIHSLRPYTHCLYRFRKNNFKTPENFPKDPVINGRKSSRHYKWSLTIIEPTQQFDNMSFHKTSLFSLYISAAQRPIPRGFIIITHLHNAHCANTTNPYSQSASITHTIARLLNSAKRGSLTYL